MWAERGSAIYEKGMAGSRTKSEGGLTGNEDLAGRGGTGE